MIPHNWPQIMILMNIATKFVGPMLKLVGAEVKLPRWMDEPSSKYRASPLIAATISAVLYIIILGYGGFWEALR